MKIILGKQEVEEAIECYLTREGINTGKYDLDIKIVVSRSSDDTKIEVDMEQRSEPVVNAGNAIETDSVPGSPFGDKDDEVAGDLHA